MYVWNELALPSGKVDGYRTLINGFNGATVPYRAKGDQAFTVYVPLEFWFCRNVGLALPLIALQYHEVKLNIEFESRANCIHLGSIPTSSDIDGTLWVDYIFLDTDERRRFAQLSHEYLIEQLQFTGDETLTGANNRLKLNFNHPCKELVWVSPKVNLSSNDWTNFALATGSNVTKLAKLQLNGQDRFAERDGNYFNMIQPFQHHEKVPANRGINVYSFALKPEEHQPSGSLNMSRIDTAVLSIDTDATASERKCKVYAVNYNVLRIMSGMGGLNIYVLYLTAYIIQGQKAEVYKDASSPCGKTLYASQQKASSASGRVVNTTRLQHILLFGKPLRAFSTKGTTEKSAWPRAKHSGTVIMKRIGQSACLLPKGVMLAYGRASETERIWVVYDGISNQRRLKIQSIPLGKLRGTRVPIPTRRKETFHPYYSSNIENKKHNFLFVRNGTSIVILNS
jgi:hypothetical protein